MKPDTAALAANDDTHVKTVGDHLADAAANVQEQAAPATGEPQTEVQMDVQPDGTATGTADNTDKDAGAKTLPGDFDPPPDIPSEKEAALINEVAQLKERLRYFEERREKEQHLLSQRDSALAAIEGAKARVQAEKQGLAEVEEEIAALLKEPMPMPVRFEHTPIGQAIEEAKAEPAPPVATPWVDLLPAVTPEQVRVVDASAGEELPTVDAVCSSLLAYQAMQGEKRSLKQFVQVYGTPWIVTHLWRDEATGACRANVVRLLTKDEYQQSYEAQFGRAVQDFDQSDEAKAQRQVGGEWCGLVVKVGRKVYVVGPQKDALHLAYLPPEPSAAPAEPTPDAVDASADETSADDARQEVQGDPDDWTEIAKRAKAIIAATGMDPAAYAHQYGLPVVALLKFLETGEPSLDKDTDAKLYDAFPPFDAEDEQEEDQHIGLGLPAQD